MKKVFIINAHHYYPFSEGKLNAELISRMETYLLSKGYEVRHTKADQFTDADAELENHLWADTIIIQTPMNWMGVPWTMKKYIDEVYLGGMQGKLCNNDGRSNDNPKSNYGCGGVLNNSKYMLSITANAPKEACNDPKEYLLQGKNIDDLFMSLHGTFRFFGMKKLPTFVCYDVIKKPNAEILQDFERLEAHLAENFS